MKNLFKFLNSATKLFLSLGVAIFLNSCEDAFKFDLPEANSKVDTALPSANFSYIPDGAEFTRIIFKDLSFESTTYLWDFGGGDTSTEQDPIYTFEDGEGVYPVTLTVSDANGASNAITIDVVVVDVFVAITPEVLNGDFNAGTANWSISNFTGGTTNPFNTSGDGAFVNYDGSDAGGKTAGAKWTKATSAGVYLSSNTRYAYQELVVSPGVEYILEYSYAIKTPEEQAGVAEGGNRVIGEILDGHFDDGAEAVATTPLVSHVGTTVAGKVTHTTVEQVFTSNASGEIAIWIYAVTDVDAYVDNVKVYPKN